MQHFTRYSDGMKYLLVRHLQTDANRLNRLAFGKNGAPLNQLGRQQALQLTKQFIAMGIDVTSTHVASSMLLRARETAELAGFKHITTNSLLNEINTDNLQRTAELVAKSMVPHQAVLAAQSILNNPPKQKIWVTHGLVIAALYVVLGLTDPKSFIPDYCEIREIIL